MAFPTLIVFPVSDMTSAVAFYSSVLGGGPYFESPYYAGFKTETGEIGLDPNARNGGPLPYWEVEDLDATITSLTEAGATVVKEPSDVGGGMTIAVLADPTGTAIGFRQAAS